MTRLGLAAVLGGATVVAGWYALNTSCLNDGRQVLASVCASFCADAGAYVVVTSLSSRGGWFPGLFAAVLASGAVLAVLGAWVIGECVPRENVGASDSFGYPPTDALTELRGVLLREHDWRVREELV